MAQQPTYNFDGQRPVESGGSSTDDLDFNGLTPASGRATGAGPRGGGAGAGRASGAGSPAGQTNLNPDLPTLPQLAGRVVKAGVKQITEPYDPRNSQGRQNLAATAGGTAAMMLASRVSGPFAPLVQTLGPIAMAGMAGGAEAAVEGDPEPVRAGLWQSVNEALGTLVAGTTRWVGRRAVAGPVAKRAQEVLDQEIVDQRTTNRDVAAAVRARVNQQVEARRIVANAETDAARARAARGVASATTAARGDIEAARIRGEGHVDSARTGRARSNDAARAAAVADTRAARVRATELVANTELDNASRLQTIAADYDAILGSPPNRMLPGDAARTVIGPQGPAQQALRTAGERVREAARTGPPIEIGLVQDELERMVAGARPSVFAKAASPTGGTTVMVGGQAMSPDQIAKLPADLRATLAKELGVQQEHPLTGLLAELRGVKEKTISFEDAHKLKELMDQAVNWDKTAKKHVERITKGLRNQLRDLLSVHAPYDQATAAYASIVPLYEKGIGRALKQAVRSGNTDRVARLLKANDPAAAQNLRRLLVDMSAEGGDRAAGEAAWDAVVDSYTHDNLVKGGIESVTGRVHNLLTQTPEFARTLYGTPERQAYLQRLVDLGEHYMSAEAKATADLAAARELAAGEVASTVETGATRRAGTAQAGRQSVVDAQRTAGDMVRDARQQGAQAVRSATQTGAEDVRTVTRREAAGVRDVRRTGAEERLRTAQAGQDSMRDIHGRSAELRQSSIGPYTKPDRVSEDAAHAAVALGQAGKFWGTYNLLRLIRGPRQADLLQYMASSPRLTQRVIQALGSRIPDRAAAALMRELLARPEAQPEPAARP